MKKIANALMVIGVGVVSFSVLYSLKIQAFSEKETSIILFIASLLLITGILIKTMINKRVISKEKFYSKLVFISLYLASVTFFFIKSLG